MYLLIQQLVCWLKRCSPETSLRLQPVSHGKVINRQLPPDAAKSAMDVLPWLWWGCGMWAYCYLPWSKRQHQLTPGWLGRTSRWKKFFQKCLKDKSIHFGWRQPYYIPLLFFTILGKRVTSVLAGPKVNMILQGVQWWMLTSVGHAPFTMGFAGAAGNLERFWSATCWRFSYVFPGAWGPYVGSLRKMKMKQTSQTWRLIICLLISWDLTYLMKIEVGVCFAAAWWTFCGCFG